MGQYNAGHVVHSMDVGDEDQEVQGGLERAQGNLLQIHAKHSVSWQTADSFQLTTSPVKDCGVGGDRAD